VPDELKQEIAGQVGGLLWASPSVVADAAGQDRLTRAQEAAVRDLADTLPEVWRRRLLDLLQDEGNDGPAGSLIPA
jgi:hypothetical protein